MKATYGPHDSTVLIKKLNPDVINLGNFSNGSTEKELKALAVVSRHVSDLPKHPYLLAYADIVLAGGKINMVTRYLSQGSLQDSIVE